MTPLLEVRDCSVWFDGLQALKGVGLRVDEWEVVGIIGPNGAGKTTLFNVITGFVQPSEGRVFFRGRDITALPTHQRVALGMGRSFQNIGLVKGATVLQNLLTAQHLEAGYSAWAGTLGAPTTFRREEELRRRAEEILDLLGLGEVAGERVAELPYGIQKKVELAAVLATDPEILLLDEPTSGMGPGEAADLARLLGVLRRELGLSILLIEHHVPVVVGVCDYVYCLNFGELLAEGTPEEVRRHPEVVRAYLGEEAEVGEPLPAGPSATGKKGSRTKGGRRGGPA